MNQVSRPMQILLGAVLVFAVLWFVALKPKTPVEEPIAAQPAATPATTPRSAAGGAEAQTGLGKAVESANNVAAQSNAATAKSEAQTGEQAPAATPAPKTSNTSTKTPAAKGSAAAKTDDADDNASSAQQKKANATINAIKRDLAARRAAVVLVYQAKGKEDKILLKRVKSEIDRRRGKVRTYYVHVSQVGYYDGLLGGLNLAQTPSTIVIAPDNQAKVLGGLTSTERIDRLTSSAIQTPVATTP